MTFHAKYSCGTIQIEMRDGPHVAVTATVMPGDLEWTVIAIETWPPYQRQGHATAMIRQIVDKSGYPVHAFAIQPEADAQGFWKRMQELGLYSGRSFDYPEESEETLAELSL